MRTVYELYDDWKKKIIPNNKELLDIFGNFERNKKVNTMSRD